MGTKKLDTEVRQRQIAEAALEIIADGGIEELNTAGIARRVGIVPSAIYRHFAGKDDVLDAVLDLIDDKLQGNVRSVCDQIDDPMERLHTLLMRHVEMIRQNEAIPHIVFSESVYGGQAVRKKKLYKIIQAYLDQIALIVEEGQNEGSIHDKINPDEVAVMFLGMIQPGAILWHLSDGEFDVNKQAEKAWQIFSGALRPHTFKVQDILVQQEV